MKIYITIEVTKDDIENPKMSEKCYDKMRDFIDKCMLEEIPIQIKETNFPPPRRQYPIEFTKASDLD